MLTTETEPVEAASWDELAAEVRLQSDLDRTQRARERGEPVNAARSTAWTRWG